MESPFINYIEPTILFLHEFFYFILFIIYTISSFIIPPLFILQNYTYILDTRIFSFIHKESSLYHYATLICLLPKLILVHTQKKKSAPNDPLISLSTNHCIF